MEQQNECQRCGQRFNWEAIVHGTDDAWIGTCECGAIQPLPLNEGNVQDALQHALIGEAELQVQSPPWIRVYRASQQLNVAWRYASGRACDECRQRTLFTTIRNPVHMVETHATLCLNCGWVCSYTVRAGRQGAPRRLAGLQWIPPCIAVQSLRSLVFRDWWQELERRRFAFQQHEGGE